MGCCLQRLRLDETVPGIRHVVMFSFKDHVSAAEEIALLKAINTLPQSIPEILHSTVASDLRLPGGQNHPAGKNRSMVWLADFSTRADFEVFEGHPAHLDLISKFEAAINPYSFAAIQYVQPAAILPGAHHIVMFNFNDSVTMEQILSLQRTMMGLGQKIKAVSTMSVALADELPDKQAKADRGDRSNRSMVAMVDFTSIEGYQVYEKHPDHLAMLEQHIKPLLLPGSRAAIQYVS